MNYQLAEVLGRSLWLMDRSSLIRLWKAAHVATPETVHAAMQAAARERQPAVPRMAGNVAVIDVNGPITYRESFFSAFFGSATIERMREQFRVALADPEAKAIVFRMDTPGGTIDGLSTFAAEIFEARGQKPIVSLSDTLMASAGYWIGAMADTVIGERSSQTGSVGVWTAHEDISGALEEMGIKVTLIYSGEHKVDGHPFGPLPDEVRADMQKDVDEVHAEFIADVAKGRGIAAADVRKSYGQGKLYRVREAMKLGVIDKTSTFETLVARLSGRRGAVTRVSMAVAPTPSVTAASLLVEVPDAEEILTPVAPKTDGEAEAAAESLPAPVQPVTDDEAAILAALAD